MEQQPNLEGVSTGSLSTSDFFTILFTKFYQYQITEYDNFKTDLLNGSPYAIIMALFSLFLGIILAVILLAKFRVDPPLKKIVKRDPLPIRDYTLEQLREFNGVGDKPILIALKGIVYDVTSSFDFYGPEGSYHCFAGRDASRAMAKFTLDEKDLSNNDLSDLSSYEKNSLDEWVEKYDYYKCYPKVGKLVLDINKDKEFQLEDLLKFTGKEEVPEGRSTCPILIGLNGNVYDCSFGGIELYGNDSPYEKLAGHDVTIALAKMSLKPEDLDRPEHEREELNDKEKETLREWEVRYQKKYPIVGWYKVKK